jgi:muramoyltetrapeptide carboxypeptidase LdcA involved in peptidoglycan recycling
LGRADIGHDISNKIVPFGTNRELRRSHSQG